jgi:hypothetical protein
MISQARGQAFYKAVVQSVLLYGSETWVITPTILQVLQSFHHWIASQITGMRPRFCPRTDTCSKPPIAEALEAAGMNTVEWYTTKRRVTFAKLVTGRLVYDLFQQAQRSAGDRLCLWAQAVTWEEAMTEEEVV